MPLGLDGEHVQQDVQGYLPLLPAPLVNKKSHCRLVADNTRPDICESVRQLELRFSFPVEKVVRFAPRRAYAFLDYGLIDLFGDSKLTRLAAIRLERRGVWTVGDLVSCSRTQVFTVIGKDQFALDNIEQQLQEFDLQFGVTLPHWRGRHGFCELTVSGSDWRGRSAAPTSLR